MGLDLHFVEWGQPDRPEMLLLHGGRDHCRSLDWVARRFADRYRILAPDLRGHGDSAWSPDGDYTIAAMAADLAALMARETSRPITIVSHSLGTRLGLHLAGVFPDRIERLVGIEGIELPLVRRTRSEGGTTPDRLREWFGDLARLDQRQPKVYATIEEAEARVREAHPSFDPETLAHLTLHAVKPVPGGWAWKYDIHSWVRPPEDAYGIELDELLASICCPVLMFYGADSWIPLPPAERLSKLRDLRLVTYPGVSHWLHHQARERFLADVDAFLSNISAPELLHA